MNLAADTGNGGDAGTPKMDAGSVRSPLILQSGQAKESALPNPAFLAAQNIYPSLAPNWHLALLSQLQMRGFEGGFRPFMLPPFLAGSSPQLGFCSNRYFRLGFPQQVLAPESPVSASEASPVQTHTPTEKNDTKREAHSDVRGSEEEEEEVEQRPYDVTHISPESSTISTPPTPSVRGFSIAELLRSSPKPLARPTSQPQRPSPSSKRHCSFLQQNLSRGRYANLTEGEAYPRAGDQSCGYPTEDPLQCRARGDSTPQQRPYNVCESPRLDSRPTDRHYIPINISPATFTPFGHFPTSSLYVGSGNKGPKDYPDSTTTMRTASRLEDERNSGAEVKEEHAENSSTEAESGARYDWLQCTRYRPPKLPRVRRRDTMTRRKLGRNPRVPFTGAQLAALEARFRQTQYLSSCDVAEMSSALCLTETRVKIWFQNRRARERRDREARAKGIQPSSGAASTTTPSQTHPFTSSPSRMGRVTHLSTSSGSAFSPVGISRTFLHPQPQPQTSDEEEQSAGITKMAEAQLTLGPKEGLGTITTKTFRFVRAPKEQSFPRVPTVVSTCHSPPSSISGIVSTSAQCSAESSASTEAECYHSSAALLATSSVKGIEENDSMSSSSDADDLNVTF